MYLPFQKLAAMLQLKILTNKLHVKNVEKSNGWLVWYVYENDFPFIYGILIFYECSFVDFLICFVCTDFQIFILIWWEKIHFIVL